MRKFIIKRIIMSIFILFFVAFIIYALLRCLPSSYVENMAQQLSMAPGAKSYEEWIAQLNAQYGLDKNIVLGFFTWLGDAVRGNFGDSWKYTVPVLQKFNDVIWVSFIMGAISLVLELIIAIPLGVVAATKQYSRADYAITAGALVGISLPTFFFATLLKLLFSVKLGWFDLYGLVGRDYAQLSAAGQFLDKAHHLVLPIVTLVIVSVGSLMRYTRTNMLEVLNSDYIRTARAKGLREMAIVRKHALKNALIPVITMIGGQVSMVIGGNVIIESIFNIPGLGSLMVTGINNRDYPTIMGITLVIAIFVCCMNLLVDLAYAAIDPRIKAQFSGGNKRRKKPAKTEEVKA